MTDGHEEASGNPDIAVPDAPILSHHEWAIIWTLLYLQPDAMNAPIREKIEAWFVANGVSLEHLHMTANMARATADQLARAQHPHE